MAVHWTRKAVKKVLRGNRNIEELIKTTAKLKEIMQDFPEDKLMQGGHICRLANIYIKIADQIIGRQKD